MKNYIFKSKGLYYVTKFHKNGTKEHCYFLYSSILLELNLVLVLEFVCIKIFPMRLLVAIYIFCNCGRHLEEDQN